MDHCYYRMPCNWTNLMNIFQNWIRIEQGLTQNDDSDRSYIEKHNTLSYRGVWSNEEKHS